jgi:hypothetical protein
MFGEVVELNDADQFLEAVDKAAANVNVIVHLYEKVSCLFTLAYIYMIVHFSVERNVNIL